MNLLIRFNRLNEAEKLLLELIMCAESDNSNFKPCPSTWYYAGLANVYRIKGDLANEMNILEKYVRKNNCEWTSLHQRLENLKKHK